MLRDGLRRLFAGKPPVPVPQTTAKRPWRLSSTKTTAASILRAVRRRSWPSSRGVDPRPGIHDTEARGAKEGESSEIPMKLFGSRISSRARHAGRGAGVDRDGLHVACGAGAVVIADLQLPGAAHARLALVAGFPSRGTLLGGGRANPARLAAAANQPTGKTAQRQSSRRRAMVKIIDR